MAKTKIRHLGLTRLAIEREELKRQAGKECPKHEFDFSEGASPSDKTTCKNCGFSMSVREAMIWTDGYVKGLNIGQEIA